MYKDEGYYDRKYANKMYCDKYPQNKKYSDDNLDQCINDFEALKLSALANANKIKQYVKSVTIGPEASAEEEIKVTLSEINNDSKKRSIKSRLGPPVSNRYQLKSAVIKIENKPPNDNTICSSWKENVRSNVMNNNMLRYELDQGNRYVAQKKVWELQKKFNAFDQYLYEKSKQEFSNRQSAYNERLERIESDMIQNLEKYQYEVNKKKQQLLQEQQEQVQQKHRRALEIKKQEEIRKERLKKKAELDAIFNSQKEFRTIYEEIVKKFGSYQDVISREVLTEFSDEVKVLVNDIDKLALKSKDGSTCPEDVIKAQQLVDGIRKQCSLINTEYCKAVTSIQNQNNAQTQRHTQKLDSPKTEYVEQVQAKQPVAETDSILQTTENSHVDNSGAISEYEYGSKLNWRKVAEHRSFMLEFASYFQQLKSDPALKKFRFDCQKAVNIPVNAIAGKGEHHTKDKLQKLDNLLAGKQIQIGKMALCAGQHPQGIAYCFDLVAKSMVKQGTHVASNPESAFPIAFVIAALWSKYPNFGKLILGYFYETCPYLAPVYPIKTSDMTEIEYQRLLGYEVSSDGVVEATDLFLKRICGTGRLFFAVMMVSCNNHPFALNHAWSWLADTLNFAPKPDISASLILQCLEVTGHSQMNCYKQQFSKIMMVLIQEYMPALGKVDSGGPYARLKEFLLKAIETGMIKPPKYTPNTDTVEYL